MTIHPATDAPGINVSTAAEYLTYLADSAALTVLQKLQEQGYIDDDTKLTPYQEMSLLRLQTNGIVLESNGRYTISPVIPREALIVIDALFPPSFQQPASKSDTPG